MQFDRVKDLIASFDEDNLKVAVGDPKTTPTGKGHFIHPVIVDNPPDDSRIVVEEPFIIDTARPGTELNQRLF